VINRRSTSSFSWDDFFLGFEIEGDRLTPVENIPKIGYFEEMLVLSRKKPVKTAGLQGSLF